MTLATAIALLIFVGAVGKSGQLPLHVWLPDAMEGPTPVSALIHAATMVAAGVFLVARVFPVFEASAFLARAYGDVSPYAALSPALIVVAWTGALTAVFAALVAVAQNDIKRILAYSTVSQLGYMFMGLGLGGIEVGLFHLITHAFFKSLLFLGAGSVIHGCHEEQDIRWMGGLRRFMPVTFATYAVGMMALSGVPLFFSGFWSKDEIMHAAMHWEISSGPYYLGIFGAFLTAFYMTRQMCQVFAGKYRGVGATDDHSHHHAEMPHESPLVMTLPLVALASIAVLLSVVGTPVWPWFHHYLVGQPEHGLGPSDGHGSALFVMVLTSLIAVAAIWLGWRLFGARPAAVPGDPDPLQQLIPRLWRVLAGKFHIDEFYAATFVRLNAAAARACDWFDRCIWDTLVQAASRFTVLLASLNRLIDEFVINLGFDDGCFSLRESGKWLSLVQNGQVQRYLRIIALALTLLVLIFIWGLRG
jgi:NADH-quinone oxidoreductase subunit L